MFCRNQIEDSAARIPDPVERLRYLRSRAPARLAAAPVTIRKFTVRRMAVLMGGMAGIAIILIWLWPVATTQMSAAQPVAQPKTVPEPPAPARSAPAEIWQVDATETTEVYSNGLRLDTSFAVHNRPRAEYGVYAPTGGAEPLAHGSQPIGIVYHTTESHLVAFEEESNRKLKRLGRNLLDLLRDARSYHYLIDRFGRAYRVVEETDAANHAGKSVWGDAQGIYVNLNDSFLGIAFEGQTGAAELVTAAQITTARQLTELLRERYRIPAENCVAHAQVSVNPFNMLIANHSDWVRDLPFAALGLPDNYRAPPASVTAFGFDTDDVFRKIVGKPWPGLELAQQQIAEGARAAATTETRYRAMLQHRYKQIAAAVKHAEIQRSQGE